MWRYLGFDFASSCVHIIFEFYDLVICCESQNTSLHAPTGEVSANQHTKCLLYIFLSCCAITIMATFISSCSSVAINFILVKNLSLLLRIVVVHRARGRGGALRLSRGHQAGPVRRSKGGLDPIPDWLRKIQRWVVRPYLLVPGYYNQRDLSTSYSITCSV